MASARPCDDVTTLLKLYELATQPHVREAQAWVLSELQAADYETFQRSYPAGSPGWRRFSDICDIMELFGVLIKHDLVAEDLFFDLFGGIDVLWEAVAGVIPGMRQATGPQLYENFEALYRRSRGRGR
jgi:hypothetical protein